VNCLVNEWDCGMLLRDYPSFIEGVTRCIGVHKLSSNEAREDPQADPDFLTPPTQLSDREIANLSEVQLELQTNCLVFASNMLIDAQNHKVDDS